MAGGGVSSLEVPIQSITYLGGSELDRPRFRIKTTKPHYHTTNNLPYIIGIKIGHGDVPEMNGFFPVAGYDPARPDEFDFIARPGAPTGNFTLDYARLYHSYQGITIDTGTMAVAEGNRIYGCQVGGPYHDTFSTRDAVALNNHYYNCHYGIVKNMGAGNYNMLGAVVPALSFASLTEQLVQGRRLVTATTLQSHGFAPNDPFLTKGEIQAEGDPPWKLRAIQNVATSTKFTYYLNSGEALKAYPTAGSQYKIYETLRPIATLSYDPQTLVATATTNADPLLAVGDAVMIKYARPSSNLLSPLRRANARVLSLWQDGGQYHFTCQLHNDPDGSPEDPIVPGYFARIWTTQQFLVQDNVFDLPLPWLMAGQLPILRSAGLSFGLWGHEPQFKCGQLSFRGNLCSYAGNPLARRGDGPWLASGVALDARSVGNLLADSNICALDYEESWTFSGDVNAATDKQLRRFSFEDSGQIHTMFNIDSEGNTVRAWDKNNQLPPAEDVGRQMEKETDDALMIAFLEL
jgi:hypothetical protein